jgi:hypothetical protein
MELSQGSEIPNGETLFRYCFPGAFPVGQKEIPISIFQDRELSCDWEKFRNDAKTSFHIGEGRNRVISVSVCDEIRNPTNPKRCGVRVPDWKQEIIYSPIFESQDPVHGGNLAHSLINGLKKAAICNAIAQYSSWQDL